MIVRRKVKPDYFFICDIDGDSSVRGALIDGEFKLQLWTMYAGGENWDNGRFKKRNVSYPTAVKKMMGSDRFKTKDITKFLLAADQIKVIYEECLNFEQKRRNKK